MTTSIKTLNRLEKEIHRLQVKARSYESKMEENFDHLQKNYTSMVMNSVFDHASKKGSGKEKIKERIVNSILENERVLNGIDKIIGHLADRTTKGIENLIDKVLHRKE